MRLQETAVNSLATIDVAKVYLFSAEIVIDRHAKNDTKRTAEYAMQNAEEELKKRGDWDLFQRCWTETREEYVNLRVTGKTRWDLFREKFCA